MPTCNGATASRKIVVGHYLKGNASSRLFSWTKSTMIVHHLNIYPTTHGVRRVYSSQENLTRTTGISARHAQKMMKGRLLKEMKSVLQQAAMFRLSRVNSRSDTKDGYTRPASRLRQVCHGARRTSMLWLRRSRERIGDGVTQLRARPMNAETDNVRILPIGILLRDKELAGERVVRNDSGYW